LGAGALGEGGIADYVAESLSVGNGRVSALVRSWWTVTDCRFWRFHVVRGEGRGWFTCRSHAARILSWKLSVGFLGG